MSVDWYYQVMGESIGPLSSAELRQHAADGKLQPDTPIRRGDSGDWSLAYKVNGLFDPKPSLPSQASEPVKSQQKIVRPPLAPTTPKLVDVAKINYKVLTQKDKWLSRKFDPETLEKALNAYGQQGWRVRTGDTASFPGFLSFLSSNREELVTILEREENNVTMEIYEYKVLTQKDKWYSGKFDPETLEKALNAYGTQGWTVVFGTSASFPGFFLTNREELIIVLSRRKPQ